MQTSSQAKMSGARVIDGGQGLDLGTFDVDALNCIFQAYLGSEEDVEMHGIPRLVCKHWAAALRHSIHTASPKMPTDPLERLQLYKSLQSLPSLRTLALDQIFELNDAQQDEFDGLLLRHPGLSTSGVPNLPQLRRLGLTIKWPFHAGTCPFLELRELHITVKDAVVDLGALRHLQLLTRLRIVGVDLGSTLCGLQELQSLRWLQLFNERYGSRRRDNVVSLPPGVTELYTDGCLPRYDDPGAAQLQAYSAAQLEECKWPDHYTFFPALSKLTALEINDVSPDKVEWAVNLRWLSLPVDCEDWASVACLPRLEHLEVDFWEVEQLAPISRLTRLQCLRLQTKAPQTHHNRVLKALSALTALRLQHFHLDTSVQPAFNLSGALPKPLVELHRECSASRHCNPHGNAFPGRPDDQQLWDNAHPAYL